MTDETVPYLVKHFKGHSAPITSLAFTESGDKILTSSLDATVILWDLEHPKRSQRYPAHISAVHCVCASPDGSYYATGGADCTARVWSAKQRDPNNSGIISHPMPVRSVDYDIQTTKLLTGCDDGVVRVFTVDEKIKSNRYLGHEKMVRSAKFSPNGQLIASVSDDKSVRVFKVSTCESIRCFTEEYAWGMAVAWSPDSRLIAVGYSNGKVKIFHIGDGSMVTEHILHGGPVNYVDFLFDGSYILTCGDDKKTLIVDLNISKLKFKISGYNNRISCAKFSPDGSLFATADHDRSLLVWKAKLDADCECDTDVNVQKSSVYFKPNEQLNINEMYEIYSMDWHVADVEYLPDPFVVPNAPPIVKKDRLDVEMDLIQESIKESDRLYQSTHYRLDAMFESIAEINAMIDKFPKPPLAANGNNLNPNTTTPNSANPNSAIAISENETTMEVDFALTQRNLPKKPLHDRIREKKKNEKLASEKRENEKRENQKRENEKRENEKRENEKGENKKEENEKRENEKIENEKSEH